jgi:hypothetical protein
VKTDDDLLEAVVRYSFETTGAPKEQIDLMMHNFRTQLLPNLRRRPPQALTDEEYAEKFEKMKHETPAFLRFLMSHEFPDLPERFRGGNN